MRSSEIEDLERCVRDVEGWLTPSAAGLLALLDEGQRAMGVRGDLFEIGVHHGRSAVLLCAMARDDEHVGVCDLFGDQEGNVSASGRGDRAMFEANVRRIVPGFDRLRVFVKRSSDLSSDEIGTTPHRVFHIDGGHLREEALADLRLAARVLHEAGAIVVDDPFRPEWPGVTEAALAFMAEEPAFVPLLLGFNKLVIVRREARDRYDALFKSPNNVWNYVDRRVYEVKMLPLAGETVRIFHIPTWKQRPGLELAVAQLVSLRSAALYRLRWGASLASRWRATWDGRRR